jgi:hypothetical protein
MDILAAILIFAAIAYVGRIIFVIENTHDIVQAINEKLQREGKP